MNKGIVMEISDNSIIVMDPEGRFKKLPRGTRSCEVGEEILFAPVHRRFRVPQMAILSGLAAAIVMCFVLVSTLTGGVPSGQVVAYVTIDINPSIELGIDNDELVQDLRGLNSDGDDLISTLEYKGKPLESVTSDILDKAEQGALGKGEGDIIISSTLVETRAAVDDEAIATKLKAQVNKHIEAAHPDQVDNYAVTAFAAPQEVRQEAKASGVSAGKYAIYLNAVNNGAQVSLDDIKNVSIHQLAKDNGGLDKLVTPSKPIDKSSLSKLVAEEKSGKLSERMKQLQSEKDKDKDKDKDKNSSGDKNAKSTVTPGKNDNGNTKAGFKPTPTPPTKNSRTDSKNDTKNNSNNNNSNNSNNKNNNWNDRNDDNDRNNDDDRNNNKNGGNNDDDDKKSTPKPDRRDDDDSKYGSSSKPRETPKPSEKPTVKPTSSSKPTAKPTVKPTAKPTVKPTATPKSDNRNFNWNWGNRDWDPGKDDDKD